MGLRLNFSGGNVTAGGVSLGKGAADDGGGTMVIMFMDDTAAGNGSAVDGATSSGAPGNGDGATANEASGNTSPGRGALDKGTAIHSDEVFIIASFRGQGYSKNATNSPQTKATTATQTSCLSSVLAFASGSHVVVYFCQFIVQRK